jgi:hypothetical protein
VGWTKAREARARKLQDWILNGTTKGRYDRGGFLCRKVRYNEHAALDVLCNFLVKTRATREIRAWLRGR